MRFVEGTVKVAIITFLGVPTALFVMGSIITGGVLPIVLGIKIGELTCCWWY